MARMELYVGYHEWANADNNLKGALNSFISYCEDKMSLILLEWNKLRTNISSRKTNNANFSL